MPTHVVCRNATLSPALAGTIRSLADRLLQECGTEDHQVNVVLTDDAEIKQLNAQYRKRNQPTNVLSFPFSDGADPAVQQLGLRELGDIVISVETARKEARSFDQPYLLRLTWLITHGLLHLLGYDHEESRHEAERMEAREEYLMQLLTSQRRENMTNLAINVDHVATIRQARGITEPDPVAAAAICELAGAKGIVVHLREDRRHIQDRDVRMLRETVKTKLNLEMGAAKEIIQFALDLKPDMVTLVPEKRKELTTEGGLDVCSQKKKLKATIGKMTEAGIPVSLFIDPDIEQITASRAVGATFVEIHTGAYADATSEVQQKKEYDLIKAAVEEAHQQGLRVNAGHGLNYFNTAAIAALPAVEELSIGHAIISRAVFSGLEQAVRDMKAIIAGAQPGLF